MKSTWKFISILAALFVCLALAGGAQAAPRQAPALAGNALQQCGALTLGGTCTLAEGETLDGDMAVLGGTVTLEEGSTVEGDLAVVGGTVFAKGTVEGDTAAIGGTLFLDGRVDGDLQVVGGMASLGANAVVDGDVETVGGSLQQEDGAQITGEVRNALIGPFALIVPGRMWLPNWEAGQGDTPVPPAFNFGQFGDVAAPPVFSFNPFWGALWWLGRSFLWAILALVLALLVPRHAVRAGEAAVARPALAGGLGCLTVLVAPVVLLLLVITVCGVPIAFLAGVLLVAAWGFGIIALGTEIGQRMARASSQDWALPVSAGLGTFALTLVTNGIGALVPCVGWLLPAVAGMIGLGAVLATRFGVDALPTNGAHPADGIAEPVEPLPPAPVSDLPVEPLPAAPEPEAPPVAGLDAPPAPTVTQFIDLEPPEA